MRSPHDARPALPLVDGAETALRLAMRDRKQWAVEFVMDTLGRNKDYCHCAPHAAENLPQLPAAPQGAAPAGSTPTLPTAMAGPDQGSKPGNTTPASAPKDPSSVPPATPSQRPWRLTDEPLNTMKSWLGPKGQ